MKVPGNYWNYAKPELMCGECCIAEDSTNRKELFVENSQVLLKIFYAAYNFKEENLSMVEAAVLLMDN